MPGFEDKVEALRRLREKKLARSLKAATQDDVACAVDHDATQTQASTTIDSNGSTSSANVEAIDDTQNMHAVNASQEQVEGGATHNLADLFKNVDASQGDADVFFCLGHCYEQGLHDCEQSDTSAARLYRLAAEQGHTVSQWRLAELCEAGRGVDQDLEEAARWYRSAANAGHMHAQFGLAFLFQDGRGVEQDDSEAFRWYLAAAEQGHALAQYFAARCLSEGCGTERNPTAAMDWMKSSANAGFPPALEALQSEEGERDAALRDTLGGECLNLEVDDNDGLSLLDIATRLANLVKDLGEGDAEAIIDELLDEDQVDTDEPDAPSLVQPLHSIPTA